MNMKEFVARHIEPRCKKDEDNKYRLKILSALKIFNVESEKHLEERFGMMYCANLLSALDIATTNQSKTEVVSYHELKDDTDSCMKHIYQFCNIKGYQENTRVSGNVKVTNLPQYDSQANSPISKTNLKSYQNALNENNIKVLNEVLQYCGVPTCANFPIHSENFLNKFPILKSVPSSSKPCSLESNRSYKNYGSYNAAKEDLKTGIPMKYFQTPYPEIQPLQASNKSIWLPINRFF